MNDVSENDMEEHHYPRSVWRGSPNAQQASPLLSDHDHDRDRRKHHRFSLANVSHALRDVVRSKPQSLARSREHSREDGGRGRTRDKKPFLEVTSPAVLQSGSPLLGNSKSLKEHYLFDKLGGVLKYDQVERKDGGQAWKEFKKGQPFGTALTIMHSEICL
jgi:hypothetical protein